MKQSLAAVAIMIGLVAALRAQLSPRELFERARLLDESNQSLAQAIALYLRVVAGAGRERDLAATAQLRAGMLHERLGHTDEARRAFAAVVAQYAESPAAVAQARVRLDAIDAAAAKASTAFATRRVATDSFDLTGSISRDGRYLTFTDWETGDVAIHDVTSGLKRRVTNKGTWADSAAFGEFSVLAPDSSQIAYAWCDKGVCDLRLVPRDGGVARVLYRTADVAYAQPCDWSPDGTQILAVLTRIDRSSQIALVAAATGAARIVKTLGSGAPPWKMAFSPDGRYIAYEFPPMSGSLKRDLFVIAADGSREQTLVQHPANEFLFGWFPDGRHVLFASDRLGTNGAWVVGVADGKPEGEPRLLKPAIGKVYGMGFVQKGDYYYSQSMGVRDVVVASLGANGVMADRQPLDGSEGGRLSGVWSPDGERIAYLTQTPEIKGDTAKVVSIRSVTTNAVRDIVLALNFASTLAWFPDGRALLLQGRDARGRGGVFRLDVSSQAVEPLAFDVDRAGGVSPDGRSLFYQRASAPGVVRRDLATGEERVVFTAAVSGMELSRDGQWLAVRTGGPDSPAGATALSVVSAIDGTLVRTLVQLQAIDAPGLGRAFAWAPRDTHVLFTRGSEVWRAAMDRGAPEKLGSVSFPLEGGTRLSVHPGGGRLAISGGSSKWELWVMENVPVSLAARP